jgi:hypothetical protein
MGAELAPAHLISPLPAVGPVFRLERSVTLLAGSVSLRGSRRNQVAGQFQANARLIAPQTVGAAARSLSLPGLELTATLRAPVLEGGLVGVSEPAVTPPRAEPRERDHCTKVSTASVAGLLVVRGTSYP